MITGDWGDVQDMALAHLSKSIERYKNKKGRAPRKIRDLAMTDVNAETMYRALGNRFKNFKELKTVCKKYPEGLKMTETNNTTKTSATQTPATKKKKRWGIIGTIAAGVVAAGLGIGAIANHYLSVDKVPEPTGLTVQEQPILKAATMSPDEKLEALLGESDKQSGVLTEAKPMPEPVKTEATITTTTHTQIVYDHITNLVRDDHPKSKMNDYNLSPDGKEKISNQGVINAAYWYGTREFGNGIDQWYGGNGTQRQFKMAQKWLSGLGLDIYDLTGTRDQEFNMHLIDAESVSEKYVLDIPLVPLVAPDSIDDGSLEVIPFGTEDEIDYVPAPADEIELVPIVPENYKKEKVLVPTTKIKNHPILLYKNVEGDTRLADSEDCGLDDIVKQDMEPDFDLEVDVKITKESFDQFDLELIADLYAEAKLSKTCKYSLSEIPRMTANFLGGRSVSVELAQEIYLDSLMDRDC